MNKGFRYVLVFLSIWGLVLFGQENLLERDSLQAGNNERIPVFVSILPQKYFVERIGREKVEVSVMVGPGQSPATYEPLPRQMSLLSQAVLYFSIGVPFEDAWLEKIEAASPRMRMIDTKADIKRRQMERFFGEGVESRQGVTPKDHDHSGLDPHIWLDPVLVKQQAKKVFEALADFDPKNKGFYEHNLQKFLADLESLDQEIKAAFAEQAYQRILVFHPAWGYFCDRYGLTQIPIEMEGKEPGPGELAQIIEFAKNEQIKVVFVQAQFSSRQAQTVAQAIGGKVISIDPLALDYLDNLKRIAWTIKEELK